MLPSQRSGPRAKDLTGMQFNSWTVKHFAERVVTENATTNYWMCECVCGTEKKIATSNLRYGLSKSCGCKTNGMGNRHSLEFMREKTYGYLEVIARAEKGKGWITKCHNCGRETMKMTSNLLRGKVFTCGHKECKARWRKGEPPAHGNWDADLS